MNKSTIHKLVDENIHHLSSGIKILSMISDEHYCFAGGTDSPWMSGIGKHFRHILDFYDRFFNQFPAVNYDLRTRSTEIEKNKAAAAARINSYIEKLQSFYDKDIHQKIDLYQGDVPQHLNRNKVDSSLGRELRYLVEHTVHHFAIISMFLKHQGYTVPEGFGIAQSTLDYEAKQ